MEKKVFEFISFAILIEATITYINQFFVNGVFQWSMALSIVLGILAAVSYKLDLPEYFGMKSNIPYLGCVLTGILLSRGSNYVYDLLKAIASAK